MLFLNLAWPALYYAQGFWSTWYVIALTLLIEIGLTRRLLRNDWGTTALAVTIANLISATLGFFVVAVGMFLFWHPVVDGRWPNATFDVRNWIVTWMLLCLTSFLIEGIVSKLFHRTASFGRVLWTSLLANGISYGATVGITNFL